MTALKIVSGTDKPFRREEPSQLIVAPLDYMPEPPDWMNNQYAIKEWQRLRTMLVNCKILDEGNLSAFAGLCAVYGDIITWYVSSGSTDTQKMSQYIKLCGEFGLTPASRSKVKPVAETENKNQFARYKTPSG